MGTVCTELNTKDCVRELNSDVREAFHYSGKGNDSGSTIHRRRHVHNLQSLLTLRLPSGQVRVVGKPKAIATLQSDPLVA